MSGKRSNFKRLTRSLPSHQSVSLRVRVEVYGMASVESLLVETEEIDARSVPPAGFAHFAATTWRQL